VLQAACRCSLASCQSNCDCCCTGQPCSVSGPFTSCYACRFFFTFASEAHWLTSAHRGPVLVVSTLWVLAMLQAVHCTHSKLLHHRLSPPLITVQVTSSLPCGAHLRASAHGFQDLGFSTASCRDHCLFDCSVYACVITAGIKIIRQVVSDPNNDTCWHVVIGCPQAVSSAQHAQCNGVEYVAHRWHT
jgi:hypothetical protein